MNISFRPVTEEDIQQFLTWRYPAPYDIYNFEDEVTRTEIEYYLTPQFQCHVMLDDAGAMIAYCSFGEDGQVSGGDYSENALDIGLGLRPNLTNQGKGIDYVQEVIDFAIGTFNPNAIRVTIAEFNLRAQKVWQKAGFVKVSQFESTRSKKPFVIYLQQVN